MRILHIHKYFHDRDGASRYMRGLMRLQEQAGHTVAPFAMHDPRNEPTVWDKYFVSALDTRKLGFGFGAWRQLRRAFWSKEAEHKLTHLIAAFRPDIIHAHNIATHLSPSVLTAARAQGIPVVMTLHDYALISANYTLWDGEDPIPPERLSLGRVVRSRFIKHSRLATLGLELIRRYHVRKGFFENTVARSICVSQAERSVMIKAGMRAATLDVIQPFSPPLMQGFVSDPVIDKRGVVFAGRLEDYKGIRVFVELARQFPDEWFTVIGDGPLAGEVALACAELPNLRHEGFLDGPQVWNRMAQAKVVVVPSLWYEPFGLVALEAMTVGTAVLVSDLGGLPEMVDEGETGIVARAGDIRAFAKALSDLLKDPRFADTLGKHAKAEARVFGSPERHLLAVLDVYKEVLSESDK